jgi:hypothetical protein
MSRIMSCAQTEQAVPDDWQRTATRRYPVGPIVELLTARLGPVMVVAAEADVANLLPGKQTVPGLGTISEITADRWATALGLHPAALWPEWWQVSA